MDPAVEQLLRRRAAAGVPIPAQRHQGLPAPIRELHRRVLAHFAATSQAPPPATLTAWAAELDAGLQDALGRRLCVMGWRPAPTMVDVRPMWSKRPHLSDVQLIYGNEGIALSFPGAEDRVGISVASGGR